MFAMQLDGARAVIGSGSRRRPSMRALASTSTPRLTSHHHRARVSLRMNGTYPITLTAPDGSTVDIDRFPVILGRSHPGSPIQPDCDLSPFDKEGRVSRQHASIEWKDGRLFITDLGSTNGTLLNGRPLSPHQPVEI